MKYTTPVAEMLALEAISVILSSVVGGDEGGCEDAPPACPNETSEL